ncbi:MAG: S8 family serine peptidase [Tannerellaceae bacterium]|jgi:subtilisin family serine protease|nr:S8 family serine peptidase [Tannerellaceae bacterium]
MMCVRHWFLFICICIASELSAQTNYCFRVYLKDKGDSGYTLDSPEAYLSQASIDRRTREGMFVDETDLPIAASYLEALSAVGACPIVKSNWFSTVVVISEDSLVVEKLKSLSMVDSVKWIWKGEKYRPAETLPDDTSLSPKDDPVAEPYGYAHKQIEMLNGIKLHEAGYRGKGIEVAVIDAGFKNVDRITAFGSIHISGTYNVIAPQESVFRSNDHGTKVLSCMATNLPGIMIGTAPEASYWLIKSEDERSEYPIEEDYWTAAVEFADSVGVKVITSSLGYFFFDAGELNYNQSQLDGKTALISRAATMAADKGILVFSSAGNEGAGHWGKITIPGDASKVVTVGAVTNEQSKSSFSSVGFTADSRVKPDVVALGTGCTIIDSSGNIQYANGTSFATPILAGLGVCLWQALPWLSNLEVINLLQQASSQYQTPDIELGYGIPDVFKALQEERRNDSTSK